MTHHSDRSPTWIRNCVFVACCVGGFGALAGSVLRFRKVDNPANLRPAAKLGADFQTTLRAVNQQFATDWTAADLEPTPAADPLLVCRRIALGLMGTVPSLEEIRAIQQQPPERQVEWWLSRVLEDRRFADHLSERLARAYVGTEEGPFLVYRRRRFRMWLLDQIEDQVPYDVIVRKLIADQGLWTSSPAVNFVTVTLDQNNDNKPDEIKLAGRTSRAFLGLRIDCLQCHNDNLGTITLGDTEEPIGGLQQHFHQLAAFYAETYSSPLGIQDNRRRQYKYQYLGADDEAIVRPDVPFSPQLLDKRGSKRQRLARWVTHPENAAFSRASVNRFWAILFGRPLVEPVDDMPLHEELPPGLQALSDDFVAHKYDIRRLMRLMVLSEPFQRDSRASFSITPKHERHWASFPLIRLRPDQVSGSILQACALQTIDSNSHIVMQLSRVGQQQDFVQRYGDMGEDEFDDRGGTVTQRLLMMNGQVVKERIEDNIVMNAATRVAALAADDTAAVNSTYLAVLTRPPTAKELEYFSGRLEGMRGVLRKRVIEDLFWVLMNSTEFSWNH